jgi:hypothetical protein
MFINIKNHVHDKKNLGFLVKKTFIFQMYSCKPNTEYFRKFKITILWRLVLKNFF